MSDRRWHEVKALFEAAVERAPAERDAFLSEAVHGDAELRAEVESLLRADRSDEALADLLPLVLDSAVAAEAVDASDRDGLEGAADVLSLGSQVGPYRVVAALGSGGMGRVFRARDARLGRDVAIKVLPHGRERDREHLARFRREAQLLAALSHPHIATLYGLEEANGRQALVLELIEGPTLKDRILEGAIPQQEALAIARQIAGALEAAHEKGIAHRDLKPANIKLTSEGVVKLLDFGIAKLIAGEGGIDFAQAAAEHATVTGMILGTAGYMSPEQARGKPVDKRTDIWAFGCVLYEMLTGQSPFPGETLSDVIAAILERAPDWSVLPADTPRDLRRLLQRCLEKDQKQRLRDIGDARIELQLLSEAPAEAGQRHDPAARRGKGMQLAAVAAVAAAASAGILWLALAGGNAAPAGDLRVTRLTVAVPQGQFIVPAFNPNIALSPDGTRLAFTPLPGPVYVRRLDSLDLQLAEGSTLPGFRGAPLFSPDGEFVSFIEGNAIFSWTREFMKTSLAGAGAVKLLDYDMFHRGDWSADGWIYFTASYPGGIVRTRDAGGRIEPVTELDTEAGERSHRFADLLPGGQALIYAVSFDGIDSYNDARIDLWNLATRERKTLIPGGTSPVYSPSGHIVYARQGKLWATPFDLERLEVTGIPMEVLDGVMMSGNTGAAHFSLSARGDLAYVPGTAEGGRRTLVWVDRLGNEEPLPLPPASYLYPRIAPDGRSLAVEIEGPNHDFYFYDFERTVLSKVTTDGMSHDPVWSPDGARVFFRSWQVGGMTMWSMPADRSAAAIRLAPGMRQSPVSVSPDGRFLAFDEKNSETGDDAWVLPLDSSGPAQPVARSRYGEGSSKFSPDGNWVAYSSDESGRPEVYVQAFPGPGPKLQISNDGGTDPTWRRSGGELYYRSGPRMMVVSVTTSPQFSASAPTMLWERAYAEGAGSSCGMPGVASQNYDVTADGQRFLMVRDDDLSAFSTQIVVVVNWAEEVKARERARLQPAAAN